MGMQCCSRSKNTYQNYVFNISYLAQVINWANSSSSLFVYLLLVFFLGIFATFKQNRVESLWKCVKISVSFPCRIRKKCTPTTTLKTLKMPMFIPCLLDNICSLLSSTKADKFPGKKICFLMVVTVPTGWKKAPLFLFHGIKKACTFMNQYKI